MKKSILCLIAIILTLSLLCACSSKDGGDNTAKDQSVDLQVVFDDINEQFDFADLTVIEEKSKLNRYYMIDETTVEQFAAEFSVESSVFTEIVLIQAVDEDSAKDIAALLNSHYDARLSEAQSYNPESVAMLENCSVEQNGTYVSLIIADNATEVREVYNSYFE